MLTKTQLMEAAADILNGSKSKAPAMPTDKLPGEVTDLGGPTPQNGKPTDDSEKIDTAKGSKDFSDKNKKDHEMHPSNASSKTVDKLKKEDTDATEDVDAIFEDGTVSEEFKTKAKTIFEARLNDKVSMIEEQLEEKYAGMLEEALQEIKEELQTKVNDYLSYVVEQWMEQNEVAIETGLRNELAEEFITGLKNLFTEHYIDIPADKVDIIEELTNKVVGLEEKLNEEVERAVELKKSLTEAKKDQITRDVCSGLTDTQVEKMKSLAESVDFTEEDEYRTKLEVIRESYFKQSVKKADETQLHEKIEDEAKKPVINDAYVAAVSQALSKNK